MLCGQASAVETDYDAGSRALPLQQAGGTARAMSMGSAVIAVPQGSASLLWNPAGLSRMRCTEVGLHHNSGLGDVIQEIAIFGMPLGEVKEDEKGGGALGGLAASIGYVNYGSFPGRDELGLPTDNYEAGDYSGSLGWGMEILPKLSAGIAVKGNRSNFAGKRYDAYAGDLGLLWNVLPSVELGAAHSNFNLGSKVGDSELASGWRVGGAWTLMRHLILAGAGELQKQGVNRIQAGAEYLIGNIEENSSVLALRAGYQFTYPNPELNGMTRLTIGLGYTLTRSLALDYAMLPTGELGTSHRLSLTFKFNCPEKPLPPAAAAPAPYVAVVAPAPYVAPAKPKPYVAPYRPPVVLKAFVLEDSHFDFDSSTLRPEGMAALRENVQLLKEHPNTRVRVSGYTSMRGTEEYNQLLSERRAAAVESFLIMEGDIAPSRISTIGYGETRPAEYEISGKKADMGSDAAKANKRVIFEVIVK
ncbi:MAG TPA: hypothetical protein DCM05_09960 [Elusimicrobia bacterium]|nr:hypothetical protein [Elusimicrobiota bacterium]